MSFRFNLNDTEDCCRCPCCGLYKWYSGEVRDEFWRTEEEEGSFSVSSGHLRGTGTPFKAFLWQEAITPSYQIETQFVVGSGNTLRYYIQEDTYVAISKSGSDYTIALYDEGVAVTPLALWTQNVGYFLSSLVYSATGVAAMPDPEQTPFEATICVFGNDGKRRVTFAYSTPQDYYRISRLFCWETAIDPTDNTIGVGGTGTADIYSFYLSSTERCECDDCSKCECQNSVVPRYLNVTFSGWQDEAPAACLCECFDETFSLVRASQCGYALDVSNMPWNHWYRIYGGVTKVGDNYKLTITMDWRSGGPIPWYTMAVWEHDYGTDKPDCKTINESQFTLTYDSPLPELGCDPSAVSVTVVASDSSNPDYDSNRCLKCDNCGKDHPDQYQVEISGMVPYGDGMDPPDWDWNGTYILDRVPEGVYSPCWWKYSFPTAWCGSDHDLYFYLTEDNPPCSGNGHAKLSFHGLYGAFFNQDLTVPCDCEGTFNLSPVLDDGELKIACYNLYGWPQNGWDLTNATCTVSAL